MLVIICNISMTNLQMLLKINEILTTQNKLPKVFQENLNTNKTHSNTMFKVVLLCPGSDSLPSLKMKQTRFKNNISSRWHS